MSYGMIVMVLVVGVTWREGGRGAHYCLCGRVLEGIFNQWVLWVCGFVSIWKYILLLF